MPVNSADILAEEAKRLVIEDGRLDNRMSDIVIHDDSSGVVNGVRTVVMDVRLDLHGNDYPIEIMSFVEGGPEPNLVGLHDFDWSDFKLDIADPDSITKLKGFVEKAITKCLEQLDRFDDMEKIYLIDSKLRHAKAEFWGEKWENSVMGSIPLTENPWDGR